MVITKYAVWFLAILIFLICNHASVDQTSYDASGCLLTSRALVKTGTTILDPYPLYLERAGYRVHESGGHWHYYFPPGPSIIAVPVVWVAAGFGLDPIRERDDSVLQRFLASLLCTGVFLGLVALFRSAVPKAVAVIFALVLSLGTSVVSTIPTAYWNQGPTVLLVTLALASLLNRNRSARNALVGGLLLGFAFWCRPTAIFAVAACTLLLLRGPRYRLLQFGIGVAIPMLLLFGWSTLNYGMLLPPYYQASRLHGFTLAAFAGVLISPSRGLFVLSPVLLFVLAWALVRLRRLHDSYLAVIGLAWFAIHTLLISCFSHWWGGHCYGSRLMLDAIPAFALILWAIGPDLLGVNKTRLSLVGGGIALAALGVVLNAHAGLYVIETYDWNSHPDVDRHPGRLWSWQEPQWRADHTMLTKLAWLAGAAVERRSTEVVEPHRDDVATFYGWRAPESIGDGHERWRWSLRRRASIVWNHTESARPDTLYLTLNSKWLVDVEVTLNGIGIGTVRHEGFRPEDYRLPVSEEAWHHRQWTGHDPTRTAVLSLRELELRRPYADPGFGFWRVSFSSPEI